MTLASNLPSTDELGLLLGIARHSDQVPRNTGKRWTLSFSASSIRVARSTSSPKEAGGSWVAISS